MFENSKEILKNSLLKAQELSYNHKMGEPTFYVGVVVVSKDRKYILLGKRKEDSLWTGPGGGAGLNESPKEAAIREAYEEANLHITPRQLKELPSIVSKSGKMVHCFMVFLDRKEVKLHTSNDPDAEVREWKWYKIKDPLPGKTDENRLLTINAAKMKILKLKKAEEDLALDLRKAILSNPMAEIDINTAEESQNEIAAEDNEWVGILEGQLQGFDYGENPREIELPGLLKLYISKVDDGLYSGYVRNNNYGDGDFGATMAQLSKMTIPSMVQALKAKGYVPKEQRKQEKQESAQNELNKLEEKQELAQVLAQYEPKELHIHIHKSAATEELKEALLKGRAPMPVGTMRTWSGGIQAVKHADGWVVVGGKHHGKLMGKFKEEPTHAKFADKHQDEKTAKKIEAGGQDNSPEASAERIKADVARRKAALEEKPEPEKPSEIKDSEKKPEKELTKLEKEVLAKLESSKTSEEEEIDRVIAENKKREVSEAKARLSIKPEFVIEERGGRIKLGDGSSWEEMTFLTSDPEHMRAIAQRDIDLAEAWTNSYKMTKSQWSKVFKEANRISGRLSKWQKRKADALHMQAIGDAVKAGLIKVDSKIPAQYPTLQENLGFKPAPAELSQELKSDAQEKTNMIAGTHFKAVSKDIQENLNKNLNDANVLVAEMGIRFKTPIYFSVTAALKSTRDMGGHYSDSEKQIVIRNKNRFNKTLMHEIGHAIDHAMQNNKVRGRGVQNSQGRSAEAQTDSPMAPELKTKYKELDDLITNSAFYESKKGETGRFGAQYYHEPTEVFARGFEVYSRVKAEEAVKAGKIDASFLESFSPDLYKEEDPELKGSLDEYKRLLDSAKMKEKTFRRLRRSSVSGEVSGKAMEEANAAYKAASNFHKEKLAGRSQYREVTPEKRKEYESKITELMDYILKHDEIRKSLEKLDLAKILTGLNS